MYTVARSVNLCSLHGKQFGGSSKIRNTIWFSNFTSGCFSKENKTLVWKDICTLMFISVLFSVAKIWKQPKYPLVDEWIKKIWYICNRILLSHKKKKSCHLWTWWALKVFFNCIILVIIFIYIYIMLIRWGLHLFFFVLIWLSFTLKIK